MAVKWIALKNRLLPAWEVLLENRDRGRGREGGGGTATVEQDFQEPASGGSGFYGAFRMLEIGELVSW